MWQIEIQWYPRGNCWEVLPKTQHTPCVALPGPGALPRAHSVCVRPVAGCSKAKWLCFREQKPSCTDCVVLWQAGKDRSALPSSPSKHWTSTPLIDQPFIPTLLTQMFPYLLVPKSQHLQSQIPLLRLLTPKYQNISWPFRAAHISPRLSHPSLPTSSKISFHQSLSSFLP